MYKQIAVLAFALLVSSVSGVTVPIAETGLSSRDVAGDSNYPLDPSSPIGTDKLFECPSGWKFFCFAYENESLCECYEMINANKDCPANTNKYCSDYIKTECSCSYPKQPDCEPIFDFNCVASKSSRSTWTCTCAGRTWGKKGCPDGFGSACYMGGCTCKKVTEYLSDYTPKPKSITTDVDDDEVSATSELKH